jgi:hypothetical protein
MAFGDFTVTRASTKLRIGSNGLYGSVANNVPAFEFNTDGTYRGLLVEPGATNLLLRSQEFDTTWATTNATVTANQAVAPDGATTADLFVPNSATAGYVSQVTGTTALNATVYTGSVFFKKPALAISNITFYGSDLSTPLGNHRFGVTINTSTFAGTAFTFGNGVVTSVNVQALPNDWYRASFTGSVSSGATGNWAFACRVLTTDASIDGTNGLFLWQAQLETGSVATSPIVTTAGTASRVADVITLSSASSLIGQTEGTVFAEVNVSRLGVEGYILRVDDGSTSNIFSIRKLSTNEIRAVLTATTSSGTVNLSSATVTTGVVKIAYAYKSGEIAISVNGVAPVTVAGTFSFGTALSRISVGANAGSGEWNDTIRSFALFPTRLANATLQSLTS